MVSESHEGLVRCAQFPVLPASAPLVQTVYFNSLVPALSIPWFILGEMQNSAIGVAGIIAIYAAYYGLYLLLFFVPLYMSLRGKRFGSAVKSGLGAFRRLGLKRWALLLTGLAAWVLGDSELARYWRRNTLENMDFDRYFLKYLVYSEAFRIDLCYWLVTTLLQTAAMAFCLYFILSWLLSKENLRIPLESPWSEDSQTILAIWSKRWARWAAAWKRLWTKKRWKAAAGAACLMLAGYLVINCYQPPLLQAPLVIGHRGSIYGIENTPAGGTGRSRSERGLCRGRHSADRRRSARGRPRLQSMAAGGQTGQRG